MGRRLEEARQGPWPRTPATLARVGRGQRGQAAPAQAPTTGRGRGCRRCRHGTGWRSTPPRASRRWTYDAALARLDPDDAALLAMRYVAGFDSNELGARDRQVSPSGIRQPPRSAYSNRLREELERWTDMTAFERQVAERDAAPRRSRPTRSMTSRSSSAVTAANRSHRWGFTMFSALKFVVAGVIVALFGGFLLAGVLTTPQGDEMAPAAVTESPSPMTTEELLSGMVTEEVEPGVLPGRQRRCAGSHKPDPPHSCLLAHRCWPGREHLAGSRRRPRPARAPPDPRSVGRRVR